jgi:cytochrome bd-type quinol oxidase subunit 2
MTNNQLLAIYKWCICIKKGALYAIAISIGLIMTAYVAGIPLSRSSSLFDFILHFIVFLGVLHCILGLIQGMSAIELRERNKENSKEHF